MSEKRDRIFKAIADPTRREIFHLLIMGSALSITQLSSHFDISRQGITKHVNLLKAADMLKVEKQGREQICYAQAVALKEIREWVSFYDSYWDDKLSALGEHLNRKT